MFAAYVRCGEKYESAGPLTFRKGWVKPLFGQRSAGLVSSTLSGGLKNVGWWGVSKNTSHIAHKRKIVTHGKRHESGNFGLSDTSTHNISFENLAPRKLFRGTSNPFLKVDWIGCFVIENPKVAHRLKSDYAVMRLVKETPCGMCPPDSLPCWHREHGTKWLCLGMLAGLPFTVTFRCSIGHIEWQKRAVKEQ